MAGAPRASREVPISEFKAHCLALVERVRKGRGEIVITRHGKPVAKVVALEEPKSLPPLDGLWAGRIKVAGDIVHTDWNEEFETLKKWDELYGKPTP